MLPSNSNSGAANRTMCCTVVTCNNSHLQQPRPQFQPTHMDDSNSILVEYDPEFETRNQEIHNVNKTAAQISLELIDPNDSKDAPIAFCDRCLHKMERIVNRPIQAITCGHSVCEGCLDYAVRMEQARLEAGGERNLTHGTEGGHLFIDCHLCQAPRAWHTKHRHTNILACASFLLISKREDYWRNKVVGAWQKRVEELEGQVEDLKRQLAEEKEKNGQLQVEDLEHQLAEEKKKNGQLQEKVVGMAEAEQRRAAAQVPPPQKQPEGQGAAAAAAAAAPVRKKPPPPAQQQEHVAKLPARPQKEQQDVAKMPPSSPKQQNKVAANVPPAQLKEPPQQQIVARMPPLPNTTVAKLPPAQQKQAPQQIQQVQRTSQAAHSSQSLPLQQQHQKELYQARAVDQAAVNSEGDYDDMDEESEDEDDDDDDDGKNDPVIAAAAEAAAAAAFATLRKPSSASSVNSAGSGSGTAAVYCAHTAMAKASRNASKHASTPAHQEQKHRSTKVLAASTTKPPAHPTNGNRTSVAAAKEIPDQQLQQQGHCQELQEQQQRLTQQVIHDTNHHDHDHDKKAEFIQHRRKPQDEDDEPLVPSQRLLPGGGRYLGNPDTVRQQEEQGKLHLVVPKTRNFEVAQRNYYLKNPLPEEKEKADKADGAGGSVKLNAAPTPTAGNVAAGKAASDKKQTKKPETVQQQLPKLNAAPTATAGNVAAGKAAFEEKKQTKKPETAQQQLPRTYNPQMMRLFVLVGEERRPAFLLGRNGENTLIQWADTELTDLVRSDRITTKLLNGTTTVSANTEGKTRHGTKSLLEKIERIVGDGLKKRPPPVATGPTPESRKRLRPVATGPTPEEEEACKRANLGVRTHGTSTTVKNNMSMRAVTTALAPKGKSVRTAIQKEVRAPPHQFNANSAPPDLNPKAKRGRRPTDQILGDVSQDNILPRRSRSPQKKQQPPSAETNNAALPLEKPKRGRPSKKQPLVPGAKAAPPVEKPKRGRPPKQQQPVPAADANNNSAPPVEKPKRGRPSKKQQLAVSDDSNAMSVSPKRGQGTQPKGATSLGKAAVRAARHSADSLLNQELVEDPADPFAFPGQGYLSGQDSNGPCKERVPAESPAKVPPAKVSTAKAPPVGRRGRSRAAKALSPKPPPPAKKTTKAKVPKKRGPGRSRKVSFVDNNDGALGIKDPANNDGALGIKDPANNGRAFGIKGSQGDPCDVDNGETLVDEAPEFGGIKSQQDDLASLVKRRARGRGRSARKLPTRRRTSKDEDDEDDELLKIERIGRFELIREGDDDSSDDDSSDDDSSDDDSSDDDDEIEMLDHAPPTKVSADSLAPGNAAANANDPDSLAVSLSPDSQVEGGQANVPAMPPVSEEHSEKPVHTGRYPRLGEHVI